MDARAHQLEADGLARLATQTLPTDAASLRRRAIELTALEYRLLEYLCYRAGEVVPRADIWERVFEDCMGGSSNAVDVYIGYLRKKLNTGDLPDLIHTRRGQGYVLEAPLP